MFIMIGAGSGHRKKAYLGVRVCPQCGKLSHFYLVEQAQQVSVFFVPVVRWGNIGALLVHAARPVLRLRRVKRTFA